MHTQLIKSLLSAVAVSSLVACGSGFVKGWGHDQPPAASAEQVCDSQGKQWIGGQCLAKDNGDNGTGLTGVTQDQCSTHAGYAWGANNDGTQTCEPTPIATCNANPTMYYDSKATVACEKRPTATAAGATNGTMTQTLYAGQTLTPVALTVSPSSAITTLKNQSCTNSSFFVLSGTKLTSAAVDPSWSAQTCSADVYAGIAEADVKVLTVSVSVEAGFLSICTQYDDPNIQTKSLAIEKTLEVLKAAVYGGDCADTQTKLDAEAALDLRDRGLVDLSPLSGLTKVQYLYLQENQISDISPIAHLPALEFLAIHDNPIDSDHATPTTTSPSPRTGTNCPTDASVNRAVRNFCLNGDAGGDEGPATPPPTPATPTPTPTPTSSTPPRVGPSISPIP